MKDELYSDVMGVLHLLNPPAELTFSRTDMSRFDFEIFSGWAIS